MLPGIPQSCFFRLQNIFLDILMRVEAIHIIHPKCGLSFLDYLVIVITWPFLQT